MYENASWDNDIYIWTLRVWISHKTLGGLRYTRDKFVHVCKGLWVGWCMHSLDLLWDCILGEWMYTAHCMEIGYWIRYFVSNPGDYMWKRNYRCVSVYVCMGICVRVSQEKNWVNRCVREMRLYYVSVMWVRILEWLGALSGYGCPEDIELLDA